jgi:DNA-binding LytR/AlgR family response regulator
MTCLIVDDNDMARLTLRQLISGMSHLTINGECTSAPEAFRKISQDPPDLVFLDIEMPGMTGIELLRSLPRKPLIIFTTSRSNYAAEAFELNVVDYLVKPVTISRLLQAVEKAKEILARKDSEIKSVEQDYLFIRDNGVLKKIKLDEILYVEAMGDYIKIYIPGKAFIVHTTLKAFEENAGAGKFMRVHRSYIVALDKIESIENGVLNIMNTPIPVAESYRSQLIRKIKLL